MIVQLLEFQVTTPVGSVKHTVLSHLSNKCLSFPMAVDVFISQHASVTRCSSALAVVYAVISTLPLSVYFFSFQGQEGFDPAAAKFAPEDLQPQPIIKKSKKVGLWLVRLSRLCSASLTTIPLCHFSNKNLILLNT